MGKMLLFCMCLWMANCAKSQDQNLHQAAVLITAKPVSQATTTDEIAAYIKANYHSETQKVRAIYAWVITHIRYDTDSANAINMGEDQQAKITVALKRRRGVCENFAAIFNDICFRSGITSFVINGYTNQGGTIDKTGHSWCAVRVEQVWGLCDPTWDQGNDADTKFFLVSPAEFIRSHMPYDPLWQLLNYPVSHRQFYNGNLNKTKDAAYFNFSDSINSYLQMDSLQQLTTSALRIQKFELYNPLVKDNYDVIKMHIEMINQDKDVELYNGSVAELNDAAAILNNFIQYRNNRFMPEKTDQELPILLDGIQQKLSTSLLKLDKIDSSPATFTIGTQLVRDKISTLSNHTKEQKDFLEHYLQTPKETRQSLFYK
ncbi:MAG: hypothetical protein H0W12_06900 [Chitinophagaceae bacterium]|nr:hypothetical protein [Chitinophagaceae bacterium]